MTDLLIRITTALAAIAPASFAVFISYQRACPEDLRTVKIRHHLTTGVTHMKRVAFGAIMFGIVAYFISRLPRFRSLPGGGGTLPEEAVKNSIKLDGARDYFSAQPITRSNYEGRISDGFSSGYMTVIAVIQGVALSVLVTNAYAQWLNHGGYINRVMTIAQACAVFSIIVVLTHRYILLTIMLRRMPNFFDILMPYAAGICEIGISLFIGITIAWWSATLVFSLAGIGAYVDLRARSKKSSFGADLDLYQQFRRATGLIIAVNIMQGCLCVFIIVAHNIGIHSSWLYALSPFGVVIVSGAMEYLGRYDVHFDAGPVSLE